MIFLSPYNIHFKLISEELEKKRKLILIENEEEKKKKIIRTKSNYFIKDIENILKKNIFFKNYKINIEYTKQIFITDIINIEIHNIGLYQNEDKCKTIDENLYNELTSRLQEILFPFLSNDFLSIRVYFVEANQQKEDKGTRCYKIAKNNKPTQWSHLVN